MVGLDTELIRPCSCNSHVHRGCMESFLRTNAENHAKRECPTCKRPCATSFNHSAVDVELATHFIKATLAKTALVRLFLLPFCMAGFMIVNAACWSVMNVAILVKTLVQFMIDATTLRMGLTRFVFRTTLYAMFLGPELNDKVSRVLPTRNSAQSMVACGATLVAMDCLVFWFLPDEWLVIGSAAALIFTLVHAVGVHVRSSGLILVDRD